VKVQPPAQGWATAMRAQEPAMQIPPLKAPDPPASLVPPEPERERWTISRQHR
jgi:hypothetical protein